MHLDQKGSSSAMRGGSEPPDNHNEINGLRRSRHPIKVAGIAMGTQDNPVNDELASVFANRRRRRRSATPVKIGGIVMGDGESADESDSSAATAPFGGGSCNKRNSYHPGMTPKRNSSIGMWGQRVFANGHNFEHYDTGSLSRGKSKAKPTDDASSSNAATIENLEISDVKEFLTNMHSEITALTSSAHNLAASDHSSITSKANVNGHSSESSSCFKSTTTSYSSISKHEEEEISIISESRTASASISRAQHYESTNNRLSESFDDDLPKLAPIANDQTSRSVEEQTIANDQKSMSVEQTIIIKPKKNQEDEEEDIIEIEPDMVKYHSGQTPHPNRVDPAQAFAVMSEAEDNDDDDDIELIVEVNPGDVHYHDAIQRQMGLIVPPPPKSSASKSPSPHLAIISDFIGSRRQKEEELLSLDDREKTPIVEIKASVTDVEKVIETAVVTTVHVKEAKSSAMQSIKESSESSTQEMQRLQEEKHEETCYVVDTNETKAMEELFDRLVAEDSVKLAKTERSHSFDSIEKWLLKSETNEAADADFQPDDPTWTNKAMKTDQDKLWARRNKRNRNKTIDYSSLPNHASWYNVTATCTTKTYNNEAPKLAVVGCQTSADTESDPETPNSGLSGRKPGLCLIIDKLKSIETKLDELKTLDTNNHSFDPESPVFPLQDEEPFCNTLKEEPTLIVQPAAVVDNAIDDDDDTLKDNSEVHEVNSATTDVSHTTELLLDDDNVVVCSPLPTPCIDEDKVKPSFVKKNGNVDIMSITTMSELDDADDEIDEDEDISSGRQSRIEELAKKIMQEEELLAQYERHRHGSNDMPAAKRDPINLNEELETVSERSEMEEEPSISELKGKQSHHVHFQGHF